jgi:hypothetical protein
MLCSVQDVEKEIQAYITEYGMAPADLYLGVAEYHSVLTDLCTIRLVRPNLVDIEIFSQHGSTKIWMVHNGLIQGTTHKILTALAAYGYSSGSFIKLGKYEWAVPGNQSGGSGLAQWGKSQPQSVRSGTINPTGEPACCCVSPSEHDHNCAWLAWKRSKK